MARRRERSSVSGIQTRFAASPENAGPETTNAYGQRKVDQRVLNRKESPEIALQREPFKTEASTGKNAALNGGRAGAITSMIRRIHAVNTGVADPESRE